MLASGLAMSGPANVELDAALRTFIPLASVALAVFCGFVKWKEFSAAPKSGRIRTLVALSTAFFLGGIALLGLAAR
jgi:hypothetical protein